MTGNIIVGIAVAAVFVVLCVGLYSLFRGGDFGRSWSNKAGRSNFHPLSAASRRTSE